MSAFGGRAPLKLMSRADIPDHGYRIISGELWWRQIYWQWKKYLAKYGAGGNISAPLLAKLGGTGVYFTDERSLVGIQTAEGFAKRVGLSAVLQHSCSQMGCVVVQFEVPMNATMNTTTTS